MVPVLMPGIQYRINTNMNLISTPTGKNWCTAALDPFHDYTQTVSGFPDEISSPSFVRLHIQTVSVAASASGDSIHITYNGLSHSTVTTAPVLSPEVVYTTTANDVYSADPLMIVRAASGNSPSLSGLIPSVGTSTKLAGLSVVPDLTVPARLIALGVEVHDTTAALNRQGTISVVHSPGAWEESVFAHNESTGGGWTVHSPVNYPPALPASKTDQSYSPSMVEWEASKGAYVVGRLIRRDYCRPYEQQFTNGSGAQKTLPRQGVIRTCYLGTNMWHHPVSTTKTSALAWDWGLPPMVPTGFQPFSVMLEGLASTSTFRVTLRTYVEYFPTLANRLVLQNALSSPPYDPTAFVEYHRAVSSLPSAVPVGMNAKGDWWRMVQNAFRVGARVAGAALPAVLTATGQPALAGAATVLGSALNRSLNPPSAKRPKKGGGGKKKNR